MTQKYTIVFKKPVQGIYTDLEQPLREGLGPECRFHEDIRGSIDADDSIIILVTLYIRPTELHDKLASIPPETMARTIIFGYLGDDQEEVLEHYKPLGLATSKAVEGWLMCGARPSPMLGHGNGLYGLKQYFDPGIFDDIFLKLKKTENYVIYETLDAEPLTQIVQLYVAAVTAARSAS